MPLFLIHGRATGILPIWRRGITGISAGVFREVNQGEMDCVAYGTARWAWSCVRCQWASNSRSRFQILADEPAARVRITRFADPQNFSIELRVTVTWLLTTPGPPLKSFMLLSARLREMNFLRSVPARTSRIRAWNLGNWL